MNTATKKLLLAGIGTLGLCGACQQKAQTSSSQSDALPLDLRGLSDAEYARVNLTGKDALGRKIERYDNYEEGNRYVGLFYFLWHGTHETGIYNVTELESTEEGRVALSSDTDPLSPKGEFHYWGEPLYGYYHSADPFVISRHIELFMDAGIDYLIIDNTNAVTYPQATTALLDTLLQFSFSGYKVPKVCFYTNSSSGMTAANIYQSFYVGGKYDDIWFSLDGLRPLLIGITENNNNASDQTKYAYGYFGKEYTDYVPQYLQAYFDVRESEWPNGDANDNGMAWMSWYYPQWRHNETKEIAIPVAQHSHSVIYASSKDNECSRGYNNEDGTKSTSYEEGQSFQQMWDYAYKNRDEIENYFVTGWNEWMAIKQRVSLRGVMGSHFVDVYDEEYSRDIEMTKTGKLKDNFYMQMLSNIKKVKMTPFVQYRKPKYTGKSLSDLAAWTNIPGYEDLGGDAIERDFYNCVIDGSQKAKYTDKSARNDIVLSKVAQDDENLYFFIQTKDDLTSYESGDESYMNILIHTSDDDPSFEDYNFILNRSINGNKGSIEKSTGGFNFTKVGDSEIYIEGKTMVVKVSRETLGLTTNTDMYFKVADHVTHQNDIMDYYVTGDSAPIGRLGYGY